MEGCINSFSHGVGVGRFPSLWKSEFGLCGGALTSNR